MAEVRRDLWRLSGPSPCFDQDHRWHKTRRSGWYSWWLSARPGCSGCCLVLNILMDEDCTTFPGKCLNILAVKKKCAFLCLNGTFCTSVCAHCPSSCHWASLWKFIPVGYLHTKISQRLPISGLNSPSCLSLSSYVRCSKPLIILVAFCWTLCSVPTCTGEPRSGPSSPVTSHQGKLEGKGHLTWCADIALPNAFQHTAGFLCCRSTLPTDANLVPSKTPGAFFARLFYNSLAPAWPGAWAGPNISLSWTSGGSCHSFL